MLPRDVLRQIRLLQIRARRAVEDFLGGEYHSVFKGAGIAFEEVREYQPGDDVRNIDWNVTARMGHPFVKRFIEERELTVMLLVDASASQRFGTLRQEKRDVAAELAAILAFSAISNNDSQARREGRRAIASSLRSSTNEVSCPRSLSRVRSLSAQADPPPYS